MIGCLRSRFLVWAILCGLLRGVSSIAQVAPPAAHTAPAMEMTVPSDEQGLMTLHVYSNLMQMPVLVLDSDHDPLPPLRPEQFSITLDNGPAYVPTHVRPEGADPISLAILLDLNGAADVLLPKADNAIARLAAAGLTGRDHVTLYALHCQLSKTLDDQPADAATLKQAMGVTLRSWAKPARGVAACSETLHLFDAIAAAAAGLKELPGRRVILAITDGADRGSTRSWREVAGTLQTTSITLFALCAAESTPDFGSARGGRGMAGGGFASRDPSSEVTFSMMSEWSGGMVLPVDYDSLPRQLGRIPGLLRGRYIVEFPRPANTTAGMHIIDVKVAERRASFIRTTGSSVPLPDPAVLSDPTTLPNDPALTPQIGKRRTIPPPQ